MTTTRTAISKTDQVPREAGQSKHVAGHGFKTGRKLHVLQDFSSRDRDGRTNGQKRKIRYDREHTQKGYSMTFSLFSTRQKKPKETLEYEKIPDDVKGRIFHIVQDLIDSGRGHYGDHMKIIVPNARRTLIKNYGVSSLTGERDESKDLCDFLMKSKKPEDFLDFMEAILNSIDNVKNFHGTMYLGRHDSFFDEAKKSTENKINKELESNGMGYQILHGKAYRIDSKYTHMEMTVKSNEFLLGRGFDGPSEELLEAHSHYKIGNYKESISCSGKALESTIKSIGKERGWTIPENPNSKTLIDLCFSNNLIPSELQSHFSSLRSTISAGVPTIRNKYGSHGQGPIVVSVPAHLAKYCLDLVASNIIYLIECHSHKKP